jgi:hypothetical protein
MFIPSVPLRIPKRTKGDASAIWVPPSILIVVSDDKCMDFSELNMMLSLLALNTNLPEFRIICLSEYDDTPAGISVDGSLL